MQKLFQMNSRVILPSGTLSDIPFTVEMTQEQWESSARSRIIDKALSKFGRTNSKTGSRTYAVTSEEMPDLHPKLRKKVIEAIRSEAGIANGIDDQCFFQSYPDSRSQKKANGTVAIDGTIYYYRISQPSAVCEFAQCLAEEMSV